MIYVVGRYLENFFLTRWGELILRTGAFFLYECNYLKVDIIALIFVLLITPKNIKL